MAPRRERGLTDNPFRLTDLSPLCSYAELRKKAETQSLAAKVDLPRHVPLQESLGSESLGDVVALVRPIGTDPSKWIENALYFAPTHDNVEPAHQPLDNEAGTSSIGRIRLAGYASSDPCAHVNFATLWLEFIDNPTGPSLSTSLDKWQWIVKRSVWKDELKRHVTRELDLKVEVVDAAFETVAHNETGQILSRAAGLALERWKEGQITLACSLINALLSSPNDDELEQRAIKPFIGIGDALSEEIQADDVRMIYDEVKMRVTLPEQATRLEHLIDAIGVRHLRTRLWKEKFTGFCGFHAVEILEEANVLIRKGSYVPAKNRLEALAKCSLVSEELKGRVQSALADLNRRLQTNQTRTQTNGQSTGQRTSSSSSGAVRPPPRPPDARSQSTSGTQMPRWVSWAIWLALVGGWRAIASSSHAPSSLDSTSPPPPTVAYPENRFEPVASVPDSPAVAAEVARREKLRQELSDLEAKLARTEAELEADSSRLGLAKASLVERYGRLQIQPNPYDSAEIDEYNRQVSAYERDRRDFNRRVNAHNSKVKVQMQRRARVDEIEEALR